MITNNLHANNHITNVMQKLQNNTNIVFPKIIWYKNIVAVFRILPIHLDELW